MRRRGTSGRKKRCTVKWKHIKSGTKWKKEKGLEVLINRGTVGRERKRKEERKDVLTDVIRYRCTERQIKT